MNLGSRPERFRELTAPYDWAGVCDDALEKALAAVRERDRVVRRLAAGTGAERERAGTGERHQARPGARGARVAPR